MENQIQPNIPPNQTQPLVPPIASPPPMFSPPINPVPPPQPFQTQPQPKKNLKGLLLAVIFLFLFAGLAFAGIKLWQTGVIFKKNTKTVEESSPTPIESTPTLDPTADWKTYTNTQYDYQISYPPEFFPHCNAAGCLNSPAVSNSISLYIVKSSETESYINRYVDLEILGVLPATSTNQSSVQTTLSGYSATKVTTNNAPFVTYYLKNPAQNGYLQIMVTTTADKVTIADQILSTFKFITVTPTSSPSGQTKGGLTTGTPVKIKSIALTTATGPLVIKGTVDSGWMFEGTMPVLLLDSSRNEIASGSATETTPGSWQSGNPVNFSVSFTFTTEATSGFLVFKNDNPSGLPENQKTFELPVKFARP